MKRTVALNLLVGVHVPVDMPPTLDHFMGAVHPRFSGIAIVSSITNALASRENESRMRRTGVVGMLT